jgi:hypothetical protein
MQLLGLTEAGMLKALANAPNLLTNSTELTAERIKSIAEVTD